MKIIAKEINGKVWGLFINLKSAKQKDVQGFGNNYFKDNYPRTGCSLNNYETDGFGWDDKGHYRFKNIWRVLTFRFRGFGLYRSISFKVANETSKPYYYNKIKN